MAVVGLMLLRFLMVRPAVAFMTAIVWTLEPLQLIHERLPEVEQKTGLWVKYI